MLFVVQESWDLQLRMFGYVTREFARIFGYVLQAINYSIPVPLDRGGSGGWNLMLTFQIKSLRFPEGSTRFACATAWGECRLGR